MTVLIKLLSILYTKKKLRTFSFEYLQMISSEKFISRYSQKQTVKQAESYKHYSNVFT